MASEKMPHFETTFEWALYLREAGFTVIPIRADDKIPVEKWEIWENDQSPEHIAAHWGKHPEHDVGILTNNNLIVLDADSPESIAALEALEKRHHVTPSVIVRTRKGVHHYFWRPDGVFARQDSFNTAKHPDRIDVKTGRSLVVAPGSRNKVVERWEINGASDLQSVTQNFITAVFVHNQKPPPMPRQTEVARGPVQEVTDEALADLRRILAHIDPDDYQVWITCGMAIYYETQGGSQGLDLYDEWSRKGSTYKGRNEVEAKWVSFRGEAHTPVTKGTLIHFAKQAGGFVGADAFQPVGDEYGASGDASSISPLVRFSLLGSAKEVERHAQAATPLLGAVCLSGEATVWYAKHGTGKTLIFMRLLMDAIDDGRVDPNKVFYINVDDSSTGLAQKLSILEEYGVHVISQGHRGFKARELPGLMRQMADSDQARGVVIVLDTLKKFVPLMDKTKASEFTEIVRGFVVKGGTVLALAHTNKRPGPDGKPIYGGTSDIVDDFDCSYLIDVLNVADSSGDRTIEFICNKSRGDSAQTVGYVYCAKQGVPYHERVLSVREVDPTKLEPLRRSAAAANDGEVIDAIVDAISKGIVTKMKLAKHVAERTSASQKNVLAILDKYAGDDLEKHRWIVKVREHGANVFSLLPSRLTSAEPAEAITSTDSDY